MMEDTTPPAEVPNRLPTRLLQSSLFRTIAKRMKCPFCGFENDKVVDSRESKEADSIRRRRECLKCEKRFTTYERIDEIPYMVVKKDGRRERFDRQKVLNGLMRACEKRPVPIS
jgi:transcriptional repressor NrdR